MVLKYNHLEFSGPFPIGTFVPSTFLAAIWAINKTKENTWKVFTDFYSSFKWYNLVYFFFFDIWLGAHIYDNHSLTVAEVAMVGVLSTEIAYFYSTSYVKDKYMTYVRTQKDALL